MNADWNHRLEAVVLAGCLLENSKKNILILLASSETVARVQVSVRELMEVGAWGDFVLEKDANGAVRIFVEAAAWLKSQGRNLFFAQTRLGTRTIIRS